MNIDDLDPSQPCILVVDDDDRIRTLVQRYLMEHNFTTFAAHDAGHAREIMAVCHCDLIIADIMMPQEDGLTFTRSVRQYSQIPIILLTALGESSDKIAGLECGADDYLAKPFEPRELVLRIQAILRRTPPTRTPPDHPIIQIGAWQFDTRGDILENNDTKISLTTMEVKLLRAMIEQANKVIDREDLCRKFDFEPESRAIDVQVTRLRKKIEDDPKFPRYLQTVRGKGYLLRIDTT